MSIPLKGEGVHTGRALFFPSLEPISAFEGDPDRLGDGGGGGIGDSIGE